MKRHLFPLAEPVCCTQVPLSFCLGARATSCPAALGPSWPAKPWHVPYPVRQPRLVAAGAANSIHMETFRRGNIIMPSKRLIFLVLYQST